MNRHIFIVAGDASGDVYGAQLITELRILDPNVEISCLGGDVMESTGVNFLYNLVREFSVMGFIPVILGMPKVMRFLEITLQFFDKKKPDIIIFIDYPGFNMYLATHAYTRKIHTIYYITPQIWAWAPWRIKKIKKYMDKMLVIFPFEVPFYEKANVLVSYVGHPLLDKISKFSKNENFLESFGFNKKTQILSILPGSRKQEILANLPIMLWAAKDLVAHSKVDKIVIALGSDKYIHLVEELLCDFSNLQIQIILKDTYNVLCHARLALVTSGTATLETAILGTPLIILYKLPKFHHFVFRHLPFIMCKYVGLPNIISDKEIVPEYVFSDPKLPAILESTRNLWEEGDIRKKCLEELGCLGEKLQSPGASKKAANEIISFLEENNK